MADNVEKTLPHSPTPEMIAAAYALIDSTHFSPRLKYKMKGAGAGVVELWKAMHDAFKATE